MLDSDSMGPGLQLVGARFSNVLSGKLSQEFKLHRMSIFHEIQMAISVMRHTWLACWLLVVQEVMHADMTLTRSKVKVKVFLRGFLVVAVVCRLDLKKWYVPFGKTDCKPTRTRIALRACEWFAFNQTVQHLHRDYPDVVNYTARFLTHPQDQVTCMECNPYPILLLTVRR